MPSLKRDEFDDALEEVEELSRETDEERREREAKDAYDRYMVREVKAIRDEEDRRDGLGHYDAHGYDLAMEAAEDEDPEPDWLDSLGYHDEADWWADDG